VNVGGDRAYSLSAKRHEKLTLFARYRFPHAEVPAGG
jgi:hypothetical protein